MEKFDSSSSDKIILTKRQISMIMAGILIFSTFIFIVGFFLGKRTVIEDYSQKVTQESLHDQIDFLLTTQSLESSQDLAEEIKKEAVDTIISNIMEDIVIDQDLLENDTKKTDSDKKVIVEKPIAQSYQGPQYAQLIGFCTKKSAQSFVNRLKKHNIDVILHVMSSKTGSGKQKNWYQIVTPRYESHEALEKQIAKIKRLEHIRDQDIKIVPVK